MNREQINLHTSHTGVLRFLDDHATTWDGRAPIEVAVDQLRSATARVDALAQAQHDGRTTPRTAAKRQQEAAMVEAALALVRPLRAFARATGDAALLARVDLSARDFYNVPDETAVLRANAVLADAEAHAAPAADYGVTAPRITSLRDAIAAFHPAGAVRDAAAAVGEAATATLRLAFADAREALDTLDDLVPSLVADADFVAAYAAARRIDDR